jgi:hypothetical protein
MSVSQNKKMTPQNKADRQNKKMAPRHVMTGANSDGGFFDSS